MPGDQDRPDVTDELRLFGETLQREAGEAITRAGAVAPVLTVRRTRRVWTGFGVAACLVAVLGGLVWIERTRDSTTAERPTASSLSPAVTTTVQGRTTTTLPRLRVAVPADPLGLEGSGEWALEERLEETWRRSVIDSCPPVQRQSTLNGRPTVSERYSATGAIALGLNVTFLDAGTTGAALAVSTASTERLQCDGATDRVELPETVRSLSSVAVGGFRVGEEFAVIAVAGPGNVVVTFELEEEGVTDALIEDLVQRAATFLSVTPSVNPYKSTPAVDDPADLVELVLAAGRFERNILPYTVAIDEMLGAPMRDVSVAVQAARVDEAQLCLAYYPFEVTERTWRLFPGMSPVPSGYADTIIKRLAATRQPDGQPDGQAGLPEAAASCWQRAVEEVVDPATTLAALLPSATPDAELTAVAEQRYTECLAALGYVVDPSVPIDQAFFDQSIAIERSVNDGTITREEALTQLDEVKAAEEADAAVRAPCDVELEGQIVGLVAVEQQAVLDANPELLQPSAALVAAMAELQPYLDAIAD